MLLCCLFLTARSAGACTSQTGRSAATAGRFCCLVFKVAAHGGCSQGACCNSCCISCCAAAASACKHMQHEEDVRRRPPDQTAARARCQPPSGAPAEHMVEEHRLRVLARRHLCARGVVAGRGGAGVHDNHLHITRRREAAAERAGAQQDSGGAAARQSGGGRAAGSERCASPTLRSRRLLKARPRAGSVTTCERRVRVHAAQRQAIIGTQGGWGSTFQ